MIMKNLICFITLLLFVQSVFCTEAKDAVLDVDGEELKSDTSYYVLSVFRPGGGLFPYTLPNETCTQAVAQLVFGDGSPVIFSPLKSKKGDVVYQSAELNIMFPPVIGCDNKWKVEYDESAKKYFVATSGLPGSGTTTSNLFQIKHVDYGSGFGSYKFVYCPKVLKICIDVVIYNYEGVRRLALGESNFPSSTFVFRKVQSVNTYTY